MKTTSENNLLYCVRGFQKSWNDITDLTISNCFKKTWFKKSKEPIILSKCEQRDINTLSNTDNNDDNEWHLDADFFQVPSDVTFQDCVAVDKEFGCQWIHNWC